MVSGDDGEGGEESLGEAEGKGQKAECIKVLGSKFRVQGSGFKVQGSLY